MRAGYKVKLCGTTTRADAELAACAGADSFGAVIEVDFSPRSLTVAAARALFHAPPLPAVALVYAPSDEQLERVVEQLAPYAVQFLSLETPERLRRLKARHPGLQVWQSLHLPAAGEQVAQQALRAAINGCLGAGVDALLFDTVATVGGKQKFGGTGMVSDWHTVAALVPTIPPQVTTYLAGGINPDNAAAALAAVAVDGIDLCSGVESRPGVRDPARVAALMAAVAAASPRQEVPR